MLDKIKIIFIDLDGTLLDINQNGTHDISNKNKEAIVKAKKEGKHIIISTGRSEMQAEKYLSKLNYTYAVTGNGSIILKHNRIIRKIEMNIRTTLLLVNYVRKNKLLIKVDGNRNVYNCYSLIQKIFAKKFRFIPFSNINLDLHKKYHKFIIWGKSKKKMFNIQEELKNILVDVSIVQSTGWSLEITHKDATKGKANSYVARKFYGITKKEEMLHIGDSMNDSTCVDYMKVVAMKNSSKDFHNLTDLKGPHYKNGGLAKVLAGEIIVEKNENNFFKKIIIFLLKVFQIK